jgi:hypothetical protein
VEEVPDALLVGDGLDRPAGQRSAVDLPVVRRHEDGAAVGREHVVVVDRREPLVLDRDRLGARLRGERPEAAAAVDQQLAAVDRPVRRLEQDPIGLVDDRVLAGGDVVDADDGGLAGLELAVGHGSLFSLMGRTREAVGAT